MTEQEITRWNIIRKKGIFKYVLSRGIGLGIAIDIVDRIFSRWYYFQLENILQYISMGFFIFFINWIINEKRYLKHYKNIEDIKLNNKMEIAVLSVMLILIFSTLIINYINDGEILGNKTTVEEVKEAVELNLSEIDYKDYITIEMKESELLFNLANSEKLKDKEINNLFYEIRIENISQKTINLYYEYFIPSELMNSIILESFYPKENIKLMPKASIGIKTGVLMKDYNSLSIEEKEIFEEFKNILYIQMNIDGKKTYIKATTDTHGWRE